MEKKHTKGEWFIQGKNLIKCGNEQIGSANSMLDEYEANAKLIAASPLLLEALINILNSDIIDSKDMLNRQEVTAAINAIKKATE